MHFKERVAVQSGWLADHLRMGAGWCARGDSCAPARNAPVGSITLPTSAPRSLSAGAHDLTARRTRRQSQLGAAGADNGGHIRRRLREAHKASFALPPRAHPAPRIHNAVPCANLRCFTRVLRRFRLISFFSALRARRRSLCARKRCLRRQ